MTDCQRCGCKSQLYLCNPHMTELRELLEDLPRLTTHLAEAATGQTRLGERGTIRGKSDEQPMRINLRASDLLDQVNRTLVRWVQDMCDTRGTTYRAPDSGSTDTAKLAIWLGRNVNAIAAGDDAGMCMDEIDRTVHHILRIINRPVPPRFCGPCPAPHPDDDQRRCGLALMARRDAIEVRCPQCRATHNVEELLYRLLNEVDHWRFSVKEVLMIMDTLGEPVHQRTFQRWRKLGIVKPTGWRRTDGRVAINPGDQSEPMYRLADVRRAKTKTGAGS